MTEKREKSFVIAMKEFFGQKPGQTLMDFNAELKALSTDERKWFADQLEQHAGYTITPAVA